MNQKILKGSTKWLVEVLSLYLPGETEKYSEKSVSITDVPVEIQTEYLPKKNSDALPRHQPSRFPGGLFSSGFLTKIL
jgi:hypothetical protein